MYEDIEGEFYGVNFFCVCVSVLWCIGVRYFIGFCYVWDYWEVYDQEFGGLLLMQEGVVGRDCLVYSVIGFVW